MEAEANWVGHNIADGAGMIADFSAVNSGVDRTLPLDNTSRTVGCLLFGDTNNDHNNKGCCEVVAQRRLRLRPWLNKPEAGVDAPYAFCV